MLGRTQLVTEMVLFLAVFLVSISYRILFLPRSANLARTLSSELPEKRLKHRKQNAWSPFTPLCYSCSVQIIIHRGLKNSHVLSLYKTIIFDSLLCANVHGHCLVFEYVEWLFCLMFSSTISTIVLLFFLSKSPLFCIT